MTCYRQEKQKTKTKTKWEVKQVMWYHAMVNRRREKENK